jgi:hypothetical protein
MPNNRPHIPEHSESAGPSTLVERAGKHFQAYDISGQALAGEQQITVECHWDWMWNVPNEITFTLLVIRYPFEGIESFKYHSCTLTKSSPTRLLTFDFSGTTQPCITYTVQFDTKCEHPEWIEVNNAFSVIPDRGPLLAPRPKF